MPRWARNTRPAALFAWLLRRKARPAGDDTPTKELVFPLVDGRTGNVHWTTDDALAAGRRTGVYRALCGATVVVASLSTPPGARCHRCLAWLGYASR